MPNVACRR